MAAVQQVRGAEQFSLAGPVYRPASPEQQSDDQDTLDEARNAAETRIRQALLKDGSDGALILNDEIQSDAFWTGINRLLRLLAQGETTEFMGKAWNELGEKLIVDAAIGQAAAEKLRNGLKVPA